MIKTYKIATDTMSAALEAVDEMTGILDEWSKNFPTYKGDISVKTDEGKEYPVLVTLTLSNEDKET